MTTPSLKRLLSIRNANLIVF